MRLRLTVERHLLPPISLLWSVPDAANPYDYTISRLLEQVNHIVPLEAEDWGLEDYVVQVGRFECIHFSPVSQVLKDDDEVTIRALSTPEVRARTLGGRDQISFSGQHLLDGVPFGRPLLRTPNRPPIRIPPRKRQRMLDDHDDLGDAQFAAAGQAVEGAHAPRFITSNGEPVAENGDIGATRGAVDQENLQSEMPARRQAPKTVHFGQLPDADLDSEDEDDDDEDFNPDEEAEADVSDGDVQSSVSEDDAPSSVVSDTSSDSDSLSSSAARDSDSDDDSDSENDSDSESDESSGPEVLTSRPSVLTKPGRGTKQTKQRNRRRQLAKKLQKKKELGELPADATLSDLRAWMQATREEVEVNHAEQDNAGAAGGAEQRTGTGPSKRKRKRGPEEEDDGLGLEAGASLEERRQHLLLRLGLSHEEGLEGTQAPPTEQAEQVLPVVKTPQADTPVSEARKRLRPNVSAIGRLLKQQTRPLDKRTPKSKPAVTFEEAPAPVDPDFYKSKLHITAYETYHEGYSLGPPPFPFQQHWDPACKIMYPLDRADRKRGKQRGKYAHSSYTAPHVAPENPSELPEDDYSQSATKPGKGKDESTENLLLDYGETSNLESDSSYAIEAQIQQDVATAAQTPDLPDVPPLPEDLESLPALAPSDAVPGAVIVFKVLMFDPAIPVPEYSDYLTGLVKEAGEPLAIKLAERDRPKMFKKHTPEEEEPSPVGGLDISTEDGDAILYIEFYLLTEPKLLVPAPA